MSILSSISSAGTSISNNVSSFFNSAISTVGNLFGNTPSVAQPKTPYAPAKVNAPVTTQKVTSNPASNNVAVPVSQGFSIKDFLQDASDVAGAVAKGVTNFYEAKANIDTLKTVGKITEVRNDALLQTAKDAPASTQIMLPATGDWLSNPGQAFAQFLPAGLTGAGVGGAVGSGLIYLVGGAALVYLIVKKA